MVETSEKRPSTPTPKRPKKGKIFLAGMDDFFLAAFNERAALAKELRRLKDTAQAISDPENSLQVALNRLGRAIGAVV